MKHILKQQEPTMFSQWKSEWPSACPPSFDSLRGTPVGNFVKQALIKEQGNLCCYCERQISEADSHFEHFRPIKDYDHLSLDYENLFCSCIKDRKKGGPLHCGHLKGDWFDENMLISPLDSSCESRFKYGSTGTIIPISSKDIAAKTTIIKLGLDHGTLRHSRRALIDIFNGACRNSLNENDIDFISVHDQRIYAQNYLQKNSDGSFNAFWTTIQYLLKELT